MYMMATWNRNSWYVESYETSPVWFCESSLYTFKDQSQLSYVLP